MTSKAESAVQLDQCLFGYKDGHRLLASSRKLPEEASSLLLVHSDLVAGASLKDEGYWTGIPVPAARCYALMRTWPAPEMPRPGCVWTQVLLIAFADVARFTDLGLLKESFSRPIFSNLPDYGAPLTVNPDRRKPLAQIPRAEVTAVLRAVYSPDSSSVLPAAGATREEAVFAVWSQQWPRLRRSFSFQTIGSSASTATRFNLRLVADARGAMDDSASGKLEDWERTAIDDLQHPGDFRRFIWRYGSDIKRGREQFRFLAEVFNATRQSVLEGAALDKLLDCVVRSLPDSADGKLLKADLLSSGDSSYSLLPRADPLDMLDYLLSSPIRDALPPSSVAAGEMVFDLWPSRAEEILSLTEKALQRRSPIADEIIPALSRAIEPSTFVAQTENHHEARIRLVRNNAQLLDSPGLEAIPQPELGKLLESLPDDADLAGRVLDRLLVLNDEAAATTFAHRFPALLAERVFDAAAAQISGVGPELPRPWMRSIWTVLRDMLPGKMLARTRTTSALAACAFMLDLNVTAGLAVSSSVWASALERSHDDIEGQSKQRLNAFLLALALAQPSQGCELLFERTFEQVHGDIAVSRLPYDAFNALAVFLPNLYWWQQWDTCLRLRKAVAEAYADGDLDPKSFLRLTKRRQTFNSLVDLAADARHGGRFMSRLSTTT